MRELFNNTVKNSYTINVWVLKNSVVFKSTLFLRDFGPMISILVKLDLEYIYH